MKKMIQKIKENKLKSICIGLSAFLFGFITVSLFNNMNNTYAIDTSPVCPVGWYLDTWSSSDTACCPKNPEYKYGGKAYGGSCSLAGSIGSNYETCPYGTKGTAGSCWIASVQPEAPACYVCGGSSQGVGSYVWGNYSQSSACTKTSLTYKNCKAPTYSCWICDANSSGNREYKWATSAPSTSCSSGSWYKSSTITSAANCVAPTPTTYTVKYDANGGTGAPSNQTKKQGESLTISTVKPTKTGYTFTSWNTKKDGTGTKYDIGALYTVDAELTLYAQYKENTVTYTIKYDANGGENAPKEQTKTKGKELVLSTTVPTKEGYKFVNWNTKKDGTGTSYNAGSKYTTEASVTLYAQYEKELNEEETKYTITFYTNDGTTEKSTKVVNKGDKVVKPEDPTREGYTFDGWYDKKENGKEYDFTKEVTSDISLYAYWSKIGDKTNEDVDKNSKTGDILIFIAWTAGIVALTYSVYYFKSRKETI